MRGLVNWRFNSIDKLFKMKSKRGYCKEEIDSQDEIFTNLIKGKKIVFYQRVRFQKEVCTFDQTGEGCQRFKTEK